MIKRSFAFFIILMLLIPAASGETDGGAGLEVLAYPGSCIVKLPLSDDMFSQDAFVYRHDLCQLSLSLAQAAFGDAGNRTSPIVPYLTGLGFSAIETCQYDVTEEDSIGSAMAWRSIQGPDGPVPLVAIAVRGAYYDEEWVSCFDVGYDDVHAGFLSAARQVMARARDYLAANGLTEKNARFWITGYSRGGAVANLTAAMLSEEGIASDGAVYAYTFATPRTVRGDKRGRHANIFNIVNPSDLFPMLPLEAWGFGRYGRTLYLPSSREKRSDYDALLSAYHETHRALTGTDGGDGDRGVAGLAEAVVRGMENAIPSRGQYSDAHRTVLAKLAMQRPLEGAEIVTATELGTYVLSSVAKHLGMQITLFSLLGDARQADSMRELAIALLEQHEPERYTAWIMSMPDGSALTEDGAGAGK